MSNKIIMSVARAISDADATCNGDYRKLAAAALEAVADYIEEAHGEFHPGVVYIRNALSTNH